MRTKHQWWWLAAILVLGLVLAACGNQTATQPEDEGAGQEGQEESPAAEVQTVNIGYSGPLSGPAAFYGENTLSGLRMAIDEINEAGGFEVNGQTYMLNLVSLDDQYMPNETGTNARRLIQEHQTPIIFIPHSGGIFAVQVFNEEENVLIAAYTSEPAVSETGNELTVRIPPRYDAYPEPFSKYLMERFGNRIALLPTATQYGKDWTEALVPVWESLGGEVVFEGSIDFAKDTDFYTIVSNALAQNPDVLFVGGPSEPTAMVVAQARELGFEGGLLVMDQAKFDEMAAVFDGEYTLLEGAAGVVPLVYSNYPGTARFVEKYNELYGKNPGSEAGYHYVAMYIFVEAMKAAGSVDDARAIRAHLQEGIDNMPDEYKVYDITEVDEDGGLSNVEVMAVIENGEIIEIELE
ncbi:Extracellular ligand-binding receptor [Caldalkalibacillus thermarum TA2.A1]|uniref:ABC transporter substrate-binding protein n=1 Tax=Caldalkalibacillus thermarum (strain TA2.A1) TaxID=986075 RepID=F5L6I4_CALTT|nr:ABC transporter substrate-binding protein [Caldalkalibacillus thermarum]EGL83045.1 Extracellular ligand-binding receptor [Caldalkalibacillus thermarum TA2.A1]QZT33562.1 ABC transporter substrate-binding protein [Caldalkalibacillus thermarum TA2.A1]